MNLRGLPIAFLIALLFTATAVATEPAVERTECIENHGGPPGLQVEHKIGRVAGYGGFTLFLDDGGYGLDLETIELIEGWNTNFQANEYDPRQAEADAVWVWINGRHSIDVDPCPACGGYHATMAAWEAERDAKLAELHELDEEIDAIWAELTDNIRALIADEDYTDFLDAHE